MKLCGWCFDDEAKYCSCLAGNGPVVPDEMVLVPREPTKDMLDSGWLALSTGMNSPRAATEAMYRAMLSAAPTLAGKERG